MAGPGHHAQDDLLALESMGLMERTRAPAFLDAGDQVFRATEAGKAVALRELEPPMVKTNAARRLFLSRTERSLILEGKKTQVRMEVKLPHHNPLGYWEPGVWGGPNGGRTASGETVPEQVIMWHSRTGEILGCPYGQPGDRLWVPEAWRPDPSADHEAWRGHGSYVEWSGGGCPPSDLPSDLKKPEHCIYQTDSLGNDLAWLSPAKITAAKLAKNHTPCNLPLR